MKQKVRWGILSTAKIGRTRVIPAIQQSKNGLVHAVASRSLESARQFARDLKIPQAYGSYEELLQDPDVDAIYIPLPNGLHYEWSLHCAEAGKPVLCEKPLAANADEAQKMVDAFAARGLPFAEAFMYRFHPQHQKVREIIAKGDIGQLQIIQSSFTFVIGSEENIRLSAELAGGALMDVGCYCVNVMRFLTGEEPDTVAAAAIFGERSGVDETIAGVLRFPSGVLGHFDAGLRTYRQFGYEIRGSEGRIVVPQAFVPDPNKAAVVQLWRGEKMKEISVRAANHYTVMVEDFADALLKNRPPRFAPQDAVLQMQVLDRLLAHARGG